MTSNVRRTVAGWPAGAVPEMLLLPHCTWQCHETQIFWPRTAPAGESCFLGGSAPLHVSSKPESSPPQMLSFFPDLKLGTMIPSKNFSLAPFLFFLSASVFERKKNVLSEKLALDFGNCFYYTVKQVGRL